MFGHFRKIAGRVNVLPRDDKVVAERVISAGATNSETFILGSFITSSKSRFIVQDVRSDMVSDRGRGSIICLVTPQELEFIENNLSAHDSHVASPPSCVVVASSWL